MNKTKRFGKANSQYKHGMHGTKEYIAWQGMVRRCHQPGSCNYAYYGGRGITVCERWRDSFLDFFHDIGPAPGSEWTLHRLRNDLGYSPENCVWADPEQQHNNKRSSRYISINGESMTRAQASRKFGISYTVLRWRLDHGWSPEQAVFRS